jgi:hypothetical protein
MTMHDDTATVVRDLAAIEDALSSGAAAHEEPSVRELQELGLWLNAHVAVPDPAYAEELRARVEAGFPPAAGSARARVRTAPRRALVRLGGGLDLLRPALPVAGLLTALVVLVVGLEALSPEDRDSAGGGGGSVEAMDESGAAGGRGVARDRAAPESGLANPSPSQALPGGLPPAQSRRIERRVSVELEAPGDEIGELAQRVTEVTTAHGGFVLRSSVSTGGEDAGGDFELRIPALRLQDALRKLSGLATVREQTESGQDVTRDYVTTADRLEAARAERRSLLRRLENAATLDEGEAIRRRLDLVAGEINGLRSQIRELNLRTNYALVSVAVFAADGDEEEGAAGGFDDAMDDAGELLVGAAGVLLRILALLVPIVLVGGLAWGAGSVVRRRRRESALV